MVTLVFRLLVLGLAAAALVWRLPASLVERLYSRGLYLWVQAALTPSADQVPFALFDLLVSAAVVGGLVACILFVRRLRAPGRLRGILAWAAGLLTSTALVYLAFLGCWGLNYEREPLTAKLDYRGGRPAPGAVVALASDAVARLNALHAEAHDRGWPEWGEMPGWLGVAFDRGQEDVLPGRHARPGVPKPSLLTFFFQRADVDGMTDPFFLEVLVNARLLPLERPFVVAHEWAHLAGYADEAEANFLGWLTCLRGPVGAQYSGWLFLYTHLLPALPRPDRMRIVRSLAAGPREDLQAIVARVAAQQPLVRAISWRVYDRYLRANRVESGVASYDQVVLLVLGTRFRPGWIPIRRGDAPPES
jgi:hypothetical protein